MQLASFVLVSVWISIIVGLWSAFNGAGIIASFVNAVVAMFALQVAYFAFLVLKSLLPEGPKPNDETDDAPDQHND